MIAGLPSLTARLVAGYRALEDRRNDGVLRDPFAIDALGIVSRAALRSGFATYTPHHRRLQTSVALRHRALDDGMLAEVAAGASRVLILGAGFDARAWRFPDALRDVRVAEVDAPSTSALKAKLSVRWPGRPPERLTTDFAQEDLGDALDRHGWGDAERTCVLWEGVTMYLPASAIKATLGALAPRLAPGSAVWLDGWAPSTAVHAFERQLVRLVGEPIRWSGRPDDLLRLASPHGYDLTVASNSAELGARYAPRRPVHPASWVARLERS